MIETKPIRTARVGVRKPRLLGYAGPSDRAAEHHMRQGWHAAHNGPMIEFRSSVTDNRAPAAIVLLSGDQQGLHHTKRSDGSFLVLDGYLVNPKASMADFLDDLLVNVNAGLRKHEFQGFLALWDEATKRVFLARDEFGIGVGYLTAARKGSYFSTDMESLVHTGIDATPDEEAIDTFLTMGYFPAPLTPLESVAKVAPGRSVVISDDGPPRQHVWTTTVKNALVGADDAVESMSVAFRNALDRSWPADGDAAVLLSGGVDSALIAVGAARLLERPTRSFTFRYEDYHGALNEGARAAAVAEHLGIPHEEIPIQPMEMLEDLGAATQAYGEPFSWGLHSYRLNAVAEQGMSTVFSGAGADGAGFSRRHRAAFTFDNLPYALQHPIRAAVRAGRPLNLPQQDNAEWVTRSVTSTGDLFSSDGPARRDQRQRLYRDPGLAVRGSRRLLAILDEAADEHRGEGRDRTIQLLGSEFATAEGSLTWNRTWATTNGMTSRLPYFDREMHDIALHIKGKTNGKDVARMIAARYLPDHMAFAPKLPQEMPVDDWLRDPLKDEVRNRLGDLPNAMTHTFDPEGVMNLFDDHVSGRGNHGWRLISLLTTAAWYDQLP